MANDPPVFDIDPGEESEFTLVQKPNEKKRKLCSSDKSPNPPQSHSLDPILVSGISKDITRNPIQLASFINKQKPMATIRETKVTRNNVVIIYPNDQHSANALLRPWKSDSTSKPSAKIPQKKDNPPVIVVVCGIHPDIKESQLQQELGDMGYEIKTAKRFISKATNKPTWKVKVTLVHENEKEKMLKEGVFIGYTRHRVEPYHELPQVTQCFKCQGFGHVFSNCPETQPKCLRCGGNHNHKQCTKEKEDKRCVNCGGDHVALYKGCPKYREARVEAKKAKESTQQKTYAQATQNTKLNVEAKLSRNEKIDIAIFCSELIRVCLAKMNLTIRSSDVLSYASMVALNHLKLTVSGQQLFDVYKTLQMGEKVDTIVRKLSGEKEDDG